MVSEFTKNTDFLRKPQKNPFFGSKFLWEANKVLFYLKMSKSLENYVKTDI